MLYSSLAGREKESDRKHVMAKEAERKETRECASSIFFVRSCFIGVEGRVLVLSVSREKCLSAFKQDFCLLVLGSCCICRTSEDKGGWGSHVLEHRGTHG